MGNNRKATKLKGLKMSKRNGAGTGTINVAILGVGMIAVHMAETLTKMAADDRYSSLINRYAVATRNDADRARTFAANNGFEKGYGSYQELMDDPEVDLVYIATPHALHAEQAIACMRAGKNVLVEKSFTGNGKQARNVIAVSDETKMMCTEAIWTRYMPSRQMILDIVDSGEIGEVHGLTANLAYPVSDKARMTDPKMAGGALLDLGVYPLNFIRMAHPNADIKRLVSSCNFTDLGVDYSLSTTLWFNDGVMGVMSANMYAAGDSQGILWGEKGYLVVENINNPAAINVFNSNHELQRRVEVPAQLTGYEYQVVDSAHAILEGKTECAAMPHDETIAMMDAMDAMRDQWGEVFPFEK
jgi:predicted dehydrogenase